MAIDPKEGASAYYNRTYMQKSLGGTRLGLAAPAVSSYNVKGINVERLLLHSEYILQKKAVERAKQAKREIRRRISMTWPGFAEKHPYSDGDARDTDALWESVYISFPGTHDEQKRLRGASRSTQVSDVWRHRPDTKAGIPGVRGKRSSAYTKALDSVIKSHENTKKKITTRHNSNVDKDTQRPDNPGAFPGADTLTDSFADNPFNPLANTHRGNLYVAVGVAAYHAVLVQLGHGNVEGRDFFEEPILHMQAGLIADAHSLEAEMGRIYKLR